jgi:hypothetical protein
MQIPKIDGIRSFIIGAICLSIFSMSALIGTAYAQHKKSAATVGPAV